MTHGGEHRRGHTPVLPRPPRSHSSPQWEEFRSSVADRKVTAVSGETGDRVGRRRSLTLQGVVAVCEVSLGLSSVLFSRMREAARKIEEKHFANHATHVEFLPVEWRSKLTLDGGILCLKLNDFSQGQTFSRINIQSFKNIFIKNKILVTCGVVCF